MSARLLSLFALFASSVFANVDWEKTEFIWNWGLIHSACEVGVPKPLEYFQEDAFQFDKTRYDFSGKSIVWIRSIDVEEFTKNILPQFKRPILLLVSVGDASFPTNCFKRISPKTLLEHKNIQHIFAQNCDINHPKVTQIPIGLDFHTIAYTPNGAWGEIGSPSQQEATLKGILATLKPTHLRKKKAFVDFQFNDSMRGGNFKRRKEFGEDRTTIFEKLLPTGLIEYGPRLKRSDLWKKKGEYAFSISPPGNGLDTHRTWEDLTLGCIVIVKSSALNPLYAGLPVVIVQDWSEVTEANLEMWLEKYSDAFTNPEFRKKLTNAFWVDQIRSKR